ncbi:unnamed protein product [Rotaria sp. Silwood1]|nr:unnamed protein product [Rotaria sp. Silwood1]
MSYGYVFDISSSSTTNTSAIDPLTNDSVNWNQLRVLLDEDNTVLTKKGLEMLKANTNLTEKEIRDWHADILRDW